MAFAIAARRARGEPLPLVAQVRPGILCRLARPVAGRSSVTSVAVEVGPRETAVRLVLSATPAEPVALEDIVRLVGRDFGLANTCAYAVVEIGRGALTRARLDLAEAILSTKDRERAKAMAREYLEGHGSDAPAVETLRLSGRAFLDRVAAHADRIDGLRSEIDLVYARVGRVKRKVNAILGAPADARVDLDAWHDDPLLEALVLRMGRQLDLAGRLKALRRGLYETIDGLKRSWFGWISTREVELVKRHGPGAALVREGLDYVTVPVDDPRYKGRTFNRVLDHGTRGRYAACASDKLRWNGIRELVIPSYHTSTTDHRHGVVDARQRRSERFRAARDGLEAHADEHAAHTVAAWLALMPLPGQVEGRLAA